MSSSCRLPHASEVARTHGCGSGTVALNLEGKLEHQDIAGAVGTGIAAEFSAFVSTSRELPNIDGVVLNPLQEPVPENAATQYVVASALARLRHRTCLPAGRFDRIGRYLNRLPTEFRVLCARDASLHQRAIRSTAGYTKWAVENHHVIA